MRNSITNSRNNEITHTAFPYEIIVGNAIRMHGQWEVVSSVEPAWTGIGTRITLVNGKVIRAATARLTVLG